MFISSVVNYCLDHIAPVDLDLLGFIPVVYVDYWDKSQHKVSPVPIRAVSPFMVQYYPPMTLY